MYIVVVMEVYERLLLGLRKFYGVFYVKSNEFKDFVKIGRIYI